MASERVNQAVHSGGELTKTNTDVDCQLVVMQDHNQSLIEVVERQISLEHEEVRGNCVIAERMNQFLTMLMATNCRTEESKKEKFLDSVTSLRA